MESDLATTQTPTRVCGQCGKPPRTPHDVMFEMKPGHDGKPWFLCMRDYREGLEPFKLGLIDSQYKTVIEIPPTEERSAAKADVGDFSRKPRKRKSA